MKMYSYATFALLKTTLQQALAKKNYHIAGFIYEVLILRGITS